MTKNTPEELQKVAENLLVELLKNDDGEKKMLEVNTPEDLEEIVVNLLVDLEQNDDCSGWECEECPFRLKEVEEDPRYGRHTCGWLLLRSATRKILRK